MFKLQRLTNAICREYAVFHGKYKCVYAVMYNTVTYKNKCSVKKKLNAAC